MSQNERPDYEEPEIEDRVPVKGILGEMISKKAMRARRRRGPGRRTGMRATS